MKPRYSESVAFLKRWNPDGPWVLCAIQHGKKRTLTTATFSVDEVEDLKGWLVKFGKTQNIYFSVNPTIAPMFKKAERKDIAWLAWMHVDVDPRAGEGLEAEQARILRLFTEDLPEDIPDPTCVIFSGGGYQAFWRIEDPMELNGDLALCEKAKLYNLRIEQAFEADACHNVDRIMRLPGTINRPDAKKRKKGRVEALAQVEFWNDTKYELADFVPAVPVQTKGETGFSKGESINVSGNVRRLDSLDELGDAVKDFTKVAINTGEHPEAPEKSWGSRSDAVWYVVCELVRSSVDDETIYSIITDPGFGISAHILDQDDPERSALRQIERAHEHAIDPKLADLNRKHAVIGNIGGKCRIMEEIADEILPGRSRLSFQQFNDFHNRYHDLVPITNSDGKPSAMPLGKWWTQHSNRRQYDRIAFVPGGDVPGCYNLWKGFAFPSRPGECGLYLAHVRDNVCKGNEEHYAYLMGWMATAVQSPASQGHTAIVLRGKQGTGKSYFAKTFGRLFGRHYLPISDPKHLIGSFNAHLRDCVVLFGDEAFYAGDKKHESVLKTLVTEDTLTIEAKGVDVTTSPNFVHLIMASNNEWVVPSGPFERRYFVLDVGDTQKQKSAYFQAIQAELDDGGYEALLYTLQTWDLSEFNVRKLPKTDGLADQKVLSLFGKEAWWFDKLQCGEILPNGEWAELVARTELLDDLITYCRDTGVRGEKLSAESLGMFIKKCVPKGWPVGDRFVGPTTVTSKGVTKSVNSPRAYRFPSLDECRKAWDASFGGPFAWRKIEDRGVEVAGQDIPF